MSKKYFFWDSPALPFSLSLAFNHIKAKENALSVQFTALTRLAVLPALPVPQQRSVLIKSVAPEFQAEQVKAKIAAEKERARREQERGMRQQQAARQATFTVD